MGEKRKKKKSFEKTKPSRKKTYNPTIKSTRSKKKEKKVDPTERPTFSRKNTNRPSRKKKKPFTPTKKYAYSSCFKQCDTLYPKKRAGCRQKCYNKNAVKRWKKSKSNKKLNPV